MAFTLLRNLPTINFAAFRKYAYAISAVLLALGIWAMITGGGLRYGVDFAGGVMVQVQFEHPVPDETVKSALSAIKMPGLTVQQFGEGNRDYLLRFTASEGTAAENLRADLNDALSLNINNNPATIQRMEMVGPKVGEDLRNMAMEALFYAVLLMTVYISGRFERRWILAGGMAAAIWGMVFLLDFAGMNRILSVGVAMLVTMIVAWRLRLNFALGAMLSLIHDVFITVGLLMFMGKEIDLNIIAAILTLVGYSLNDTIIVYDRIRENLRGVNPDDPKVTMNGIINDSINQTLSRTILTSGTTLVVCACLFFWGGTVIHDFALTILMGILVGTYSSVFVASPVLLAFGDVRLYQEQQKVDDTVYEKPGEHGMV